MNYRAEPIEFAHSIASEALGAWFANDQKKANRLYQWAARVAAHTGQYQLYDEWMLKASQMQ